MNPIIRVGAADGPETTSHSEDEGNGRRTRQWFQVNLER